MRVPRRFGRLTLTVLLTLPFAALLSAGPAHAAVTPPGGKTNWVVSVGGINNASVNNYKNWVRLGYYVFNPDGTAATNYWTWNAADEPARVNAVTADCGGDVPTCSVQTVAGFTGSPMGGFTGTYSYLADGRVQVQWTHNASGAALGTPLTEWWTLTTGLDDGKIARLASPTMGSNPTVIPAPGTFSSYSATFGIGYGSNASLDDAGKATMSQLRNDSRYNAEKYTGDMQAGKSGAVTHQGTGGLWTFGSGVPIAGDPNANHPWRLCANQQCMGWIQHATGCECPNSSDVDRVRYFADISGGRRNAEWYWCQCLAQGAPCYKANNHPHPLLQVIDDAGEFQGWVGVEAATQVNSTTLEPIHDLSQAFYAVFDMVSDPLRAA
jgi:hypothetical protein